MLNRGTISRQLYCSLGEIVVCQVMTGEGGPFRILCYDFPSGKKAAGISHSSLLSRKNRAITAGFFAVKVIFNPLSCQGYVIIYDRKTFVLYDCTRHHGDGRFNIWPARIF